MESIEYKVDDNKYKTIKELLQKEFNFSKRLILKLKKENRILVNETPQFVNYSLKENDIIKIDMDFEETSYNIVATKMDLNIVYEDDSLIILNKPPKIETHPTVLNYANTLSNGLKYYFDSIGLKRKIRPVNRLDKDTSGLIVFAKNQFVQEELIRQMKNNIFIKEYVAIVENEADAEKQNLPNKGEIVAKIARKEGSILERCIDEEKGVYAKTFYEVLERINNLIVLKLKLETGRTHQIRVHMKHIGYPLIGDFLYGKTSDLIDRQALHSYRLEFIHPISKEKLKFEIPLPDDILNILKRSKE